MSVIFTSLLSVIELREIKYRTQEVHKFFKNLGAASEY